MAANAPSLKTVMEKWCGGKGSTLGSSDRSGENKSGKGRNEHGYAVDCVPMGDVKRRVEEEERNLAVSRNESRLRHTDSEEQLWQHDSGIVVERSVGVEVSDSNGTFSEKKARRGSSVRALSAGMISKTPPIEEVEEEGRRGRKMRDHFEAV